MLAFLNPSSGNAEAARRSLRRAGGFELRELPPDAIPGEVRRAADAGAPRILIAGGDGSNNAAANAIAGTTTELAILPCGTLNHLAKDLGLPLDLDHAARLAHDGVATFIDAASVNDRLFLNTSSVGAYVTFVRVRNRLERRTGYHLWRSRRRPVA